MVGVQRSPGAHSVARIAERGHTRWGHSDGGMPMEGRRPPECPHEPRPWRRHYLDALISGGATKAASGQRIRGPPPGCRFHTRRPRAENLGVNLRNLPARLFANFEYFE